MSVDLKVLVELIIIVLILKLVVSRWKPPIQESFQAIMCISLGTIIGIFMNPTKEGIITGVIASGFAFYGGDLVAEFKTVREDLEEGIEEKDKFQKK